MPTMKYGSIRGVDRPVSRIVLGTSGMRSYEQAAGLLDFFADRGGNTLDTAHVYGNGVCERVVGQWLRRRTADGGAPPVLVGKGAHPPNCRPEAIGEELTTSLDRLGVERIDLYLLHRDDDQVPVGEWVDALEAEVHAGRITAYGGSNWCTARAEQANALARRRGARGFVALSNHFSLARMEQPLYTGCLATDDEDLAWLDRHGVALLPWSSQARGFFSTTDPATLDPNMRRCWDVPVNRDRRRRAEDLARRFGTRAINIALAFVLGRSPMTFPLIGPRDVAEAAIALDALDTELDDEALRWLVRDDSPAIGAVAT